MGACRAGQPWRGTCVLIHKNVWRNRLESRFRAEYRGVDRYFSPDFFQEVPDFSLVFPFFRKTRYDHAILASSSPPDSHLQAYLIWKSLPAQCLVPLPQPPPKSGKVAYSGWSGSLDPNTTPPFQSTLDPPLSALVPPPLGLSTVHHDPPCPITWRQYCPAGCRFLDAAERWPDHYARHDFLSSSSARPPTSHLDSRRPAGHPAPTVPETLFEKAQPFRDHLPARDISIGSPEPDGAYLQQPLRSHAGPGCAARHVIKRPHRRRSDPC